MPPAIRTAAACPAGISVPDPTPASTPATTRAAVVPAWDSTTIPAPYAARAGYITALSP